MRRRAYEAWLRGRTDKPAVVASQMTRVAKIEACLGDLDAHIATDDMVSLIERLTYSAADYRNGRPNPSLIPIDGNILDGLRSYKSAAVLYRRFRHET